MQNGSDFTPVNENTFAFYEFIYVRNLGKICFWNLKYPWDATPS